MAFGRIETYFESMLRTMEVRYVIPDDPRSKIWPDGTKNPFYERPDKVMVLLNGHTNTGMEWLLNSDVTQLAMKYNIALFLPSGENRFYLNQEGRTEHFGDYVGKELIDYVARRFNLSEKKEDHFADEGVEHSYYETPGVHDFAFWNQYVEKAFKWCIDLEQ